MNRVVISALPFDEYEIALVDEIDRTGEELRVERRMGQPKPPGSVAEYWTVYGRRRGIAEAVADRRTLADALGLLASIVNRAVSMEDGADFALYPAPRIEQLVDAAERVLAIDPPFTAAIVGGPGSVARCRQDAINELALELTKSGFRQ